MIVVNIIKGFLLLLMVAGLVFWIIAVLQMDKDGWCCDGDCENCFFPPCTPEEKEAHTKKGE